MLIDVAKELTRRLDDAWAGQARFFAAVESKWATNSEYVAMVEGAQSRPELRRLFPFNSLARLCFSRCSDYPFTVDCPCLGPYKGKYLVHRGWLPDNGEVIFESPNLAAALDVVVQHLPSETDVWLGTRDHRV